MLSLYKSERFQNDLHTYKEEIEKISDDTVKKNVENLISKLVSEVKRLDSQHEEMIINRQMSSMSDDSKTRIMEIRKSIDKKLKDWNSVSRSKQSL
jgi:ElaB/YqjD/DUF883 family membrane-anchored ribosome-binding protein